MVKSTDDWSNCHILGTRIGESREQFSTRLLEISLLQARLRSNLLSIGQIDDVRRWLRDLQGITFYAPDNDD
jgi:hypothetical protein